MNQNYLINFDRTTSKAVPLVKSFTFSHFSAVDVHLNLTIIILKDTAMKPNIDKIYLPHNSYSQLLLMVITPDALTYMAFLPKSIMVSHSLQRGEM